MIRMSGIFRSKRHIYFWSVLFVCFLWASSVQAGLRDYVRPYDISEVEWYALNWTSAWRGTLTPADPFILERIEYSRQMKKIIVYIDGKAEDATQDNLNKSVKGITGAFREKLPEFKPETDLTVKYTLKSEDEEKLSYIEYNAGKFSGK